MWSVYMMRYPVLAVSLWYINILIYVWYCGAEGLQLDRRYRPDWSDLDTRPLPQWYDEAKVGIFLHWGVYSVPSFSSEWFWKYWSLGMYDVENYVRQNYPPKFTYQDFASQFHAEFFDPVEWANLFHKAGAKYVVLTTKHHEGFTMFPSRYSFSWNSVDVGPKTDITGALSTAVRDEDMKFGVYYSLLEWQNPMYLNDFKNQLTTSEYVDKKMVPEIRQLVQEYMPSIFWADGDWDANDTYWKSTELISWMYNDSPVKDEIVVNDRWGSGVPCHHGDFYNCKDRYNPSILKSHKWENAFTVDRKSWGYRTKMHIVDVLSAYEVVAQLVTTVSCGGNVLINVGPTKEGTIAPIFQERLLTLGHWLRTNGEAIYGSSPWLHQNDTLNGNVWYTCKKTAYNATHPTSPPQLRDGITAIYAIALKWPSGNVLKVKDVAHLLQSGVYTVTLLGHHGKLNWKIKDGEAHITLPDQAEIVSKLGWTLKFARDIVPQGKPTTVSDKNY